MNKFWTLIGCALVASMGLAGCADVEPQDEGKIPDTIFQQVEGWELVNFSETIESAHPYGDNLGVDDEVQTVRAPFEAQSMRIHFGLLRTERGYDHVVIRDMEGREIQRLTGNFRGWSDEIPGNAAQVSIVSDYSVTAWGFSINGVQYRRAEPTEGEWIAQTLGDDQAIRTAHPYANSFRQKWTITAIPEAQRIRVHFTGFDTERGYDVVALYDGNGRQVATYTGRRGDFTSVEVGGNVVTIELITDYSVRRYGFDVLSYEILADIAGCQSDEECGPNQLCQQVQCIRWPCPALCVQDPNADRMCGTRGAGHCEEGEYCHREPRAICGMADAPGVCRVPPTICTREFMPVCGCDRQTYSNACNANAAGVSVLSVGACEEPEQPACVRGGCSSQLCIEEGEPGISTCEFRAEYACFQQAACERQDNGQCGHTITAEVQSCLDDARR